MLLSKRKLTSARAWGTGGLTFEHAFLKRTHAWSAPILSKLLREYRDASAIDDNRLFLTLANFQATILHAYDHLVSVATLEGMVTRSNARVFAKSCFRDIGDVIESCLFPFLKIRLNVLRIATASDSRDVENLTLGQTIAELALTDAELYSPLPFDIRLSQWRNIAFHSSYDVRSRCRYGDRHPKRFECTPTQLLDVLKYTNDVYYVHKVAYELFGIDNTDRVLQVRKASGDSRVVHGFDFDFNTDTIPPAARSRAGSAQAAHVVALSSVAPITSAQPKSSPGLSSDYTGVPIGSVSLLEWSAYWQMCLTNDPSSSIDILCSTTSCQPSTIVNRRVKTRSEQAATKDRNISRTTSSLFADTLENPVPRTGETKGEIAPLPPT